MHRLHGRLWVAAQFLLLAAVLLSPQFPAVDPLAAAAGAALETGGALLLAAGAGLMLAGAIPLGRRLSPFPAPARAARLVERGPFGMVRHPIYGGLIMAAVGYAAWLQSLTHVAGALALLVFFDRKARHEERLLAERFPGYDAYRRRVRKRLLPWLY